tara:strand:+ start:1831 stop:2058 length:228 start_codon:yes stop_codon:yes gene_type:complete
MVESAPAQSDSCVSNQVVEESVMKKVMTKEEVLDALTKLYDICVLGSSEPDDGWSRMADAISTAEDVARQEATDD